MTPGIHLMHKPVGVTSFSLVQPCMTAMRSAQPHRRPRVCHGGTLDPFAHGLMLMLIGSATRLFDHLHAIPKVYVATIRWGLETDNGDLLGKPTMTGDGSSLTTTQLDKALAAFVGWHEQVPPLTSAKRVDGERAYAKAHRGEVFELPPSRVYLHEARWMDHDLPRRSVLHVTVRGGYYVRSLARDLGRRLGCGAHLTALHRVAIGPWDDPGPGRTRLIQGDGLLLWAPSRQLSDAEVGELRQKQAIERGRLEAATWPLPPDFPDPSAPIRGFHRQRLVFLLRVEGDRLIPITELPGGL